MRNKLLKRLTSGLLITALTAATFTACGSKEDAGATTETASAESNEDSTSDASSSADRALWRITRYSG